MENQRELKLTAAKNLILRDLISWEDGVSWDGSLLGGNNSYGADGADPMMEQMHMQPSSTANFKNGGGVQFLMPLGFRRELATVRHHQLQLAKARAQLQDEELEVSHALVEAIRNIDTNCPCTDEL